MSYYDKKLMSATLLKRIYQTQPSSYKEFVNVIDSKFESEALAKGIAVHEYLLEGKKDVKGYWEDYKEFKPILDAFDGQREVEIFKDMFGIKCKSKIDLLNYEVWDLKTTSASNLESCIEDYDYKLQLAFYELMTGLKSNLIIVNANKRPSMLITRLNNLWREKQIIEDTINKYSNYILEWQE